MSADESAHIIKRLGKRRSRMPINLHEHLPSDSPHGYPTLRPENSLEEIINNGFAIGMIQADSEALDFAEFIRDTIKPQNILELGTLCGGWMYVVDRMAQPGLRISVDMPWEERVPTPRWPPDMFRDEVKALNEIIGNAHDQETLVRVKIALAHQPIGGIHVYADKVNEIDLLFIDADHSYAGAKKHFEMYSPLVRPGGYVAFHDIRNGWPCGKYYDEICANYRHWEFVGPENALFGIGCLQI